MHAGTYAQRHAMADDRVDSNRDGAVQYQDFADIMADHSAVPTSTQELDEAGLRLQMVDLRKTEW